MSIYLKKKHHRKVWEEHYGPIPKEPNGRSYEIHHIKGKSNDISNLKLVTIREHYDIHYAQGDWAACLLIAQRMEISPQEKSALCSKHIHELHAKQGHPFLDGKMSKEVQRLRVENGTHHLLGGKIQRNTQNRLLTSGKQNFKQDGFISSSKIRVSCLGCRKEVGWSGFSQHIKKCSRQD